MTANQARIQNVFYSVNTVLLLVGVVACVLAIVQLRKDVTRIDTIVAANEQTLVVNREALEKVQELLAEQNATSRRIEQLLAK